MGRGVIVHKGSVPCRFCKPSEYAAYEKQKAMAATGIPRRFFNATVDSYVPKEQTQALAKESVNKYITRLPKALDRGVGMTFSGTVGSGKTHLAAAILDAALQEGYSVHFAAEDTIFDTFKENWSEPEKEIRYLTKLQKVRFLVIDDIGIRRPSDYVSDRYEAIFNTRYANGLPTIITTNKSFSQLEEVYERQMSRLAGNLLVEIIAPDNRKQ